MLDLINRSACLVSDCLEPTPPPNEAHRAQDCAESALLRQTLIRLLTRLLTAQLTVVKCVNSGGIAGFKSFEDKHDESRQVLDLGLA